MTYRFIKKHSETFPVVKMAKALGIHRSRYYRWLQTSEERNLKVQIEDALIAQIKDIQEESRYSLGTPRITKELNKRGNRTNHKRVSRILRENSLNHRAKKRFRITTDSGHNHMVSPNLLNRDFSATAPNQKWVSDITYLWTQEGWLYLCVVIDLFSRKVVGWATSSRIDADLLLMAFWRSVQNRKPGKGLIFHSDRGSQYCSKRFRKALESLGMKQSMSRKGYYWDNACAESFFKSLKTEWFYDEQFKTRQDANNMVFEYVEIFYNRRRMHSSLGYDSPEEYELKIGA